MSVSVLTEPAILPVKRYHPAQVALHWVIAAFIFCAALLAMGQEGEGSRQAAAGIAGIPTLDIYMILGLRAPVLLLARLVMHYYGQRFSGPRCSVDSHRAIRLCIRCNGHRPDPGSADQPAGTRF